MAHGVGAKSRLQAVEIASVAPAHMFEESGLIVRTDTVNSRRK